jgi:adenosylhomocysteine nucleosidase
VGTIAFVCAMPMELRPLAGRLGLRRDGGAGTGATHAGSLDGRPVVAIVTGMGTRLAAEGTARLLESEPLPEQVVVVGITGAVDDETPIGALVVPERVVDGATGREHRHRPPGTTPAHGVLWTTTGMTPPDELPALRARGVVALDMETAAIAAACEERDVPWSVFRCISDRATDGSVDDEVFHLSRPDGTPNLPAAARYVARHPGRVPGLVRLARGARLAADRAAEAAIAALRAPAPAP